MLLVKLAQIGARYHRVPLGAHIDQDHILFHPDDLALQDLAALGALKVVFVQKLEELLPQFILRIGFRLG